MKLSLGVKLIGGFVIVALLVLFSGVIGITMAGKISNSINLVTKEKSPIQQAATKAAASLKEVQIGAEKLIHATSKLKEIKQAIEEGNQDFLLWTQAMRFGTESDDFKKSNSGQRYIDKEIQLIVAQGSEDITSILDEIQDHHHQLQIILDEIDTLQGDYMNYTYNHKGTVITINQYFYMSQVHQFLWIQNVRTAAELVVPIEFELDRKDSFMGKFIDNFETFDEKLIKNLGDFDKQQIKMYKLARKVDAQQEAKKRVRYFKRLLSPCVRMEKLYKDLIEYSDQTINQLNKNKLERIDALSKKINQISDLITNLISIVDQEMNTAVKESDEAKKLSNTLLLIVTISAFFVSIIFGIVLSMKITKPLLSIEKRLKSGAAETVGSSAEVSSAASQLSEGAADQAASLEETSSSLEEMNTMTAQNAQNAAKAKDFAQEAKVAAESGDGSMTQLSEAMGAINQSSDQISKIIKTIEEIAFQTNLLALNAAVEAARAGEHGKGFSVVAEEVRNLARRSEDAAKDTSSLISENVKKAKRGYELSNKTGGALKEIIEKTSQAADIIADIAQANQEQSHGIDQISEVFHQIDRVTQNNAMLAQTSAEASQDLTKQAASLNSVVDDLNALVHGGEMADDTPPPPSTPSRAQQQAFSAPVSQSSLSKPAPSARKHVPAAKPPAPAGDASKTAEDIIPLDDADFEDF